MEPRRGFTIIELAIVMAIIAILLVVGFVSFRSYQANARDKERESDVAAIQIYLESIYAQEIRDHSGNIIKEAGTYPAVVLPRSDGVNSVNRTADEWKIVFDGLSVKSLYAPGQTGDLSDGVKNLAPSGEYSASGGSAVDLSNCDSGWCYYSVATAKSDGYNDFYKYKYIPISSTNNNTICAKRPADDGSASSSQKSTQACRSYILVYKQEATNSVVVVESKHK